MPCMTTSNKSGSIFMYDLSGHCCWMHTAWESFTFMCHWNGNREGEMKSYRDCWIALTADDPERKASTVSVVALAFSSIIIYTNNFPLDYCNLSESRYVWPWLKIRLHLLSPDHGLAIENLTAARFVFHTTSFSLDIELQLQKRSNFSRKLHNHHNFKKCFVQQ
jgi:hypothetical protein